MGYTFTGSRYGWSYQLIFVGFCGQSYKQGFIRLTTDCSTIHLRQSSNEGLNPTLGLVASCYVERLFLCCRPVCCWLGWGPWALVTPLKVTLVGVRVLWAWRSSVWRDEQYSNIFDCSKGRNVSSCCLELLYPLKSSMIQLLAAFITHSFACAFC